MRVCLVRPPAFVDEFTYPYNIECLITELRAAGHEVSFVDGGMMTEHELRARYKGGFANRLLNKLITGRKVYQMEGVIGSLFEPEEPFWGRIVEKILSNKPDVVGLSCYSASMSSASRIVSTLAKAGYKGRIVLGGTHPSAEPLGVMKNLPDVDYVVVGEGEETFVELLEALSAGSDPRKVEGLCVREDGEAVMTMPRPLIDDLGRLPVPNFDFINDEPYFAYLILTSRGCPYNCSFCASRKIFGRRARFRPPDVVAKEVETLVRKTGTRRVRLGDDTFTVNKKHIRALIDELGKLGLKNLRFDVGSRIDTIDREKIDLLLELGVVHISFGVETGSERILKEAHKGINLDDVVPTIKMVNDAGIDTLTFFIVNHPTERAEDMEDTLGLIKRLNSNCPRNRCEINTGFPYPATQWWDYCEEKGLVDNIDFYRHAHRYNHQQSPVVNMTAESDGVLMNYKKKMEKEVLSQHIKIQMNRGVRMLLTEPRTLFRKLFN